MARPLRIEFPGALYHVMSRGNERKPIVRDDADREKRLDWLRRTVQTYAWRLHAFALMCNHDHLFVETPEANLSAAMQRPDGNDRAAGVRAVRACRRGRASAIALRRRLRWALGRLGAVPREDACRAP